MGILPSCMSVHQMYAQCPQRSEEVKAFLELEFQKVVSCYMGITDPEFSGRAASIFNP